MNAPAKIEAPASPGYWEDGYGWAMAQAALMRAGAVDDLDWENIIEEIESMGRSEYDSVESALRLVLLHVLKWEHQPTLRSVSWVYSMRAHLMRFDRRLRKNPGLKGQLDEIFADAYADARLAAAGETGLGEEVFPVEPPSWEFIRAPRSL